MNILWVATKSPWPPSDGGRLHLHTSLRALEAAGHNLTLVAPVAATTEESDQTAATLAQHCTPHLIPARPRSLALDAAQAQLRRMPLTIIRHGLPAVRHRVDELLEGETFDIVQVEQVQALNAVKGAMKKDLPIVLRAQNVESDLWAQAARDSTWRRPFLEVEARRLATWEGQAVRRCAATLALTAEDAARLATLSSSDQRIHVVPAPFDPEMAAAEHTLPGSPAVILFGSRGWMPNIGGATWFVKEVWPKVKETLPGAVLHLFGMSIPTRRQPNIVTHSAPNESREAFPRGSVLVVPLKLASGVRIKILESWARGVPVVATPEAARGLNAEDGKHLLLARSADEFTERLCRIQYTESLAADLIANGRLRLRTHHSLSQIAAQHQSIYNELI